MEGPPLSTPKQQKRGRLSRLLVFLTPDEQLALLLVLGLFLFGLAVLCRQKLRAIPASTDRAPVARHANAAQAPAGSREIE